LTVFWGQATDITESLEAVRFLSARMESASESKPAPLDTDDSLPETHVALEVPSTGDHMGSCVDAVGAGA